MILLRQESRSLVAEVARLRVSEAPEVWRLRLQEVMRSYLANEGTGERNARSIRPSLRGGADSGETASPGLPGADRGRGPRRGAAGAEEDRPGCHWPADR